MDDTSLNIECWRLRFRNPGVAQVSNTITAFGTTVDRFRQTVTAKKLSVKYRVAKIVKTASSRIRAWA